MRTLFTLALISTATFSWAQTQKNSTTPSMPLHKYVIERDIPNAGKLSEAQLKGIATQSCSTISSMKEPVQWLESYVTDNKVYCIYLAESEDAVQQHAKLAGFPANKISEVKNIIDPTVAN